LTLGLPVSVHSLLKSAVPVVPRSRGAAPGADGVSKHVDIGKQPRRRLARMPRDAAASS
jgi:hypothetical protein